MRRIGLILVALCFGFLLLGLSLKQIVSEAGAVMEASGSGEVDYYLAYPGMLPDHPFYWAKMVRDRVMLIVERNPQKRLERLLLYADKRIGAAEVLAEGNKPELAVSTATKAEKYLEQAAAQYLKLQVTGNEVQEYGKQLEKAQRKHYELLGVIFSRVPTQLQSTVGQVQIVTEQGWRTVRERLGMETVELKRL